MKQRFTFLDIRAITNELSTTLSNSYIQNIYTEKRRFIIKFNTSNLLIEPGIRFHLVDTFAHEINHFGKCMRILRRQKLKSINQCGIDRVVVLEFNNYKLFMEFYNQGNLIITNLDNEIVHLLRTVPNLFEKGMKYVANNPELELSFDLFKTMHLKRFLPVDKELVENIKADYENIFGMSVENAQSETHSEENLNKFAEYNENLIKNWENVKNYGVLTFKNEKPNNIFPVKIKTNEKSKIFATFNECCAEFFKDKVVEEKVRKSKAEVKTEKRVDELLELGLENRKKAEILAENENTAKIFEVFDFVKKEKMKWKEFDELKKKEDEKGNAVSKAIKKVDFKKKTANVEISGVEIEVFIDQNIFNNIKFYYEKAKQCEIKSGKTKAALSLLGEKMAPKEEKVKTEKRKSYWFEKFHFVPLNGFIVIGGKNAQQNEIIVKKHLTNLYFHCSVQGGSSVILEHQNIFVDVQNSPDNSEVAGAVALCMSKCWDARVVQPVFSVFADQVSKSAPTGEFITKGAFVIRGKKNEINVFRLEYGVGVLFKIPNLEKPEDLHFSIDPKDEIEHAMLVSGPWSLIQHYKFRAKLVFGSTKKGQIAKDLMKLFADEAHGVQKEFIRKIHMDEYMNVLIQNAKLGKFKS